MEMRHHNSMLSVDSMTISRDGETLNVTNIRQLDAATCQSFESRVKAALPRKIRRIDIDLTRTHMDCGGLGALVALRKCARERNNEVAIRLLNPSTAVQRLFSLAHMGRLFPIELR